MIVTFLGGPRDGDRIDEPVVVARDGGLPDMVVLDPPRPPVRYQLVLLRGGSWDGQAMAIPKDQDLPERIRRRMA